MHVMSQALRCERLRVVMCAACGQPRRRRARTWARRRADTVRNAPCLKGGLRHKFKARFR